MTNEEAIKVLSAFPQCMEKETREALDLAIKALTYNAKVKMYGSELAMAIAEYYHDEEYIKELNERHKKEFGKTLEESEKEGVE